MPKSVLIAFLAAVLVVFASGDAMAHKMKVFAAVEGDEIVGYAYFSPGGRMQKGQITATTPDNRPLAALALDGEGNFRFPITELSDIVITVSGGDGHQAQTLIRAENLPGGSPSPAPSPNRSETAPNTPMITNAANDGDALARIIERAVERQVRPLREQLDAYQEKIWMHDILGGLGIIAGIAGLGWGLSRGRRNSLNQGTEQ